MLPTFVALGAGSTPVVNEVIDAAISTGMTDAKTMITGLIGLVFVGTIGIICISGGADFALKKIKGLFHMA